MTDMTKESGASVLYGRLYDDCNRIAKRYYQDEAVIQSATATLYINAVKDQAKVDNYIKLYKKGFEEVASNDRQVAYNIYTAMYAELLERYPVAQSALEHWIIKVGIVDPKELEIRLIDYFYRNGYLLDIKVRFKVNDRTECEEYGDSTD